MNLTAPDRFFRTALGLVMLTTGLDINEPFVWIIGTLLFVTGAASYCPLNQIMHVLSGDSPSEYEIHPHSQSKQHSA